MLGFVLGALSACDNSEAADEDVTKRVLGGEPEIGQLLVKAYGCGACHIVPGVRDPRGQVGPPLRGLADRVYLAGGHANTPDTLIRWIVDPPSLDADTAMPDLGVSDADARHIAAYLYEVER